MVSNLCKFGLFVHKATLKEGKRKEKTHTKTHEKRQQSFADSVEKASTPTVFLSFRMYRKMCKLRHKLCDG